MDTAPNSRRPRTRPVYRAKFSGLVLNVIGERQVMAWSPEIELRPLSEGSDLYGAFMACNGHRFLTHGYLLRHAKTAVECKFDKQVTPWQEILPW